VSYRNPLEKYSVRYRYIPGYVAESVSISIVTHWQNTMWFFDRYPCLYTARRVVGIFDSEGFCLSINIDDRYVEKCCIGRRNFIVCQFFVSSSLSRLCLWIASCFYVSVCAVAYLFLSVCFLLRFDFISWLPVGYF
jgi:hypothetical protein